MVFQIFNSRAAHIRKAHMALSVCSSLTDLESELNKRGWRWERLEGLTDLLFRYARCRLGEAGYAQAPSYVSIHEAAHAVFALHAPGFGRVRNASIFPHDGMGGWVSIQDKQLHTLTKTEFLNLIALSLAGFSGEKIKYGPDAYKQLRGDIPPNYETGDMIHARKHAKKYLRQFTFERPVSVGEVIAEAQKIADETIKQFWPQVVSLAQMLERRYLLVESEIYAAVVQPESKTGIACDL